MRSIGEGEEIGEERESEWGIENEKAKKWEVKAKQRVVWIERKQEMEKGGRDKPGKVKE